MSELRQGEKENRSSNRKSSNLAPDPAAASFIATPAADAAVPHAQSNENSTLPDILVSNSVGGGGMGMLSADLQPSELDPRSTNILGPLQIACTSVAIPLCFPSITSSTYSLASTSGGFDTSTVSSFGPNPQPFGLNIGVGSSGFGNLMASDKPHYVGLVNQAMTCYLNSLLQTLYMTPEFRNAVYRWEFGGKTDEERKCIPYQLQKLFLLLQTSEKMALETKELTRSFGWDSSHAWDQHDVQELCRVMFDALEFHWKHTDQTNLINYLYQGTLKDYVKCLKCGKENAREDVFLDLPLAIRPFGATNAYGSIEEALRAFVQPEVLDGTNQYFCESCKEKCDAHKGLKITRFPYLLTIQLKRFDFDYTTLTRVKLNDKMTFPAILNLNGFIEHAAPALIEACDEDGADGMADDDTIDAAKITASSALDCNDAAAPNTEDVDEGICMNDAASPNESGRNSPSNSGLEQDSVFAGEADTEDFKRSTEKIRLYAKSGPYVYELFSIMVHSGSANGGHYYAYIKNLDTDRWWCFNDQLVCEAPLEDLARTFGGRTTTWGYSYGQANAYMLMYRQVDANKNMRFIESDALPAHLIDLLSRTKAEEVDRRQREEYERSLLKLKVWCYLPKKATPLEKTLSIPKTETLNGATVLAYGQFDLCGYDIDYDCCRLIRYQHMQETIEYSFSPEDGEKTMEDLQFPIFNAEFLLEIRPEHVSFRHYIKEDQFCYPPTFSVIVIDLTAETLKPSFFLRANSSSDTQRDIIELLAEYLQQQPKRLRVICKTYSGFKIWDAPSKTLKDSNVTRRGQLYVEICDEDQDLAPWCPTDYRQTKMFRLLDRIENSVILRVELPSEDDYLRLGFSNTSKPSNDGELPPNDIADPYSPTYLNDGSSSTITEEPSIESPSFPDARVSCPVSGVDSALSVRDACAEQAQQPQQATGFPTSFTSAKDMYYQKQTQQGSQPFAPPHSLALLKRSGGTTDGTLPSVHGRFMTAPVSCSDTTSEYSTASEYSGAFVTPGVSRPHTPDPALLPRQQPVEVLMPSEFSSGCASSSYHISQPSSPMNIDSTDISSDLSSPNLTSPNVSPVGAGYSAMEDAETMGLGDARLAMFCNEFEPLYSPLINEVTEDDMCVNDVTTTASDSTEQLLRCRSPGVATRCQGISTPNVSPVDSFDQPMPPQDQAAFTSSVSSAVQSLSEFGASAMETHQTANAQSTETDEKDSTTMPRVSEPPEMEIGIWNPSTTDPKPWSAPSPGTDKDDLPGTSNTSVAEDQSDQTPEDEELRYFELRKTVTRDARTFLEIEVDKRMLQSVFRDKIVPFIKVPAEQFKIYKVIAQNEYEWQSKSDMVQNLAFIPVSDWKAGRREDVTSLKIKLGRPLKENEAVVKFFEFLINQKEFCRFSLDITCEQSRTMAQLKSVLAEYLTQTTGNNITANRIRIRNKYQQSPKEIVKDTADINSLISRWSKADECELFYQLLQEPDESSEESRVVVFCRRWKPASLTIEPFEEILLESFIQPEQLFLELSKKTKIPLERLELCSKKNENLSSMSSSGYPFETSPLTIHDWGSESWHGVAGASQLYASFGSTLSSSTGGHVFYRDSIESPMQLSEQDRKELQIKENARLRRSSVYSTRRERALKIYTEFSSSQADDDLD